MTQLDRNYLLSAFVQEEMADALTRTMVSIVPQLQPITRLRLLAFMHLLENPDDMKANLVVEPSGGLRLTLTAAATPDKNQQH